MDDFYIYYAISEETPKIGQIRAVAPHVIAELGDTEFIRVPAEYGLQFTVGRKSISHWAVQYDSSTEGMILAERKIQMGTALVPVFTQVPLKHQNPEMLITFERKSKRFRVEIPKKVLKQPKHKLHFFVTPLDDPNMMYFDFSVDFEVVVESAVIIPCLIDLPNKFSVFTNKVFDRYRLRILK